MRRRPYQDQALEKIKRRFGEGCNRQLLHFATGVGKTVVLAGLPEAMELCEDDARYRMIVLVHTDELVKQTVDKLKRWNPGLSVGVEKANQRSNGEQLIVASVATIGRKGSPRLTKFDPREFRVLVCDEAHRSMAPSYRTIFDHFGVQEDKGILLLGVTATPNRADGQGLGTIYQEIVDHLPILDAVTQGWLVDVKGIRVRTDTCLDNVRTLGGDFNLADLAVEIDNPRRNDLIARTWLEKAKGRQTVAFTSDIAHAKHIAEALVGYGVAASAIWGDDPDREAKLVAHRDGKITVLSCAALLLEGYDDWHVSCIVLAAPTKSEGRYTQAVGRGFRLPDGVDNLVQAKAQGIPLVKTDCLVLDFVDVTAKHSLVTLPSLVGLSSNLDLHGMSITEAHTLVADVKRINPSYNVAAVTDATKLKGVAQEVDLLKVTYAPEIINLTEYQWHKTGPSAYVLLLLNNEHLVVMADVKSKWLVSGRVKGKDVFKEMGSLDTAIKWADKEVRRLGGVSLISVVKRSGPAWHDLPPQPNQIAMAKQFKIPVPDGVTRGQLSQQINAFLAKRSTANLKIMEDRAKGLPT